MAAHILSPQSRRGHVLGIISKLARRCQSIDRLWYCLAILGGRILGLRLLKDTWFLFSCIWLVVPSTYGPRTSALYMHF